MGRSNATRRGGIVGTGVRGRDRSDSGLPGPLFREVASTERDAAQMAPSVVDQDIAHPSGGAKSPNTRGVVLVGLATLPVRAVVDETALAEALGVSKRTLRRMVARFEVPPPVRLAGRSTWIVGRVLTWLDARAERASRDAERMARRMDGLK